MEIIKAYSVASMKARNSFGVRRSGRRKNKR